VVLYVGRFAERKGVRELLQAIPAVLAASDNVRFVLVGGYRHATGEAVAADRLPPPYVVCVPASTSPAG
jgi:glycosyltransferase involved in cell wall biosynthesis